MKKLIALIVLVLVGNTFGATSNIPNPWLAQSLTFTLEWNANPASDNVTHYRIYYRDANAGPDWYEYVEFPSNQTGGTIFGVPWALEYEFILTARNAGGESDPSDIARATQSARPGRPGAPMIKKVELTVTISQ